MKVDFPTVNVEKSDNFATKSFDFGDKRAIIHILRAKMYSNPIKTICQEIMSNSRDAHREVGKDNVPIEIKLPDVWDESIHFIDYGPGISPDRMENIYLMYGNSTKRDDNKQTGGFGLGAKTPFSYTDTFSIVTVTQDGPVRNRREYVAYVDDTQIGALSLLRTEETTEGTGTRIIISVAKHDFKTFEDYVKEMGRFWEPRPKVVNRKIEWPTEQKLLDKGDYYLTRRDYYASSTRDVLAIIDGIAYPINQMSVQDDSLLNYSIWNAFFSYQFRLIFKTGEIKVTANREEIDYQPDIKKKIANKIVSIVNELSVEAQKSIDDAACLRDAIKAYDLTRNLQFANLLNLRSDWQGKELVNNFRFSWCYNGKPDEARIVKYHYSGEKIFTSRRQSYNETIHLNGDYELVEDDTNEPKVNVHKIRTLLDKPDIGHVYVVKAFKKEDKDRLENDFNWSALNPIKLSTVAETKPPKVINSSTGQVTTRSPIIPFKQLKTFNHGRGTGYEWEGVQGVDITAGGTYVKLYNNEIILNGTAPVTKENVFKLAKLTGTTVYGVLSRQASNLPSGWTTIYEAAKKKYEEYKKNQDVVNYLTWKEVVCIDHFLPEIIVEKLKENVALLDNKDGSLAKYLESSSSFDTGYKLFTEANEIASICGFDVLKRDQTSDDLIKYKEAFETNYKMLTSIQLNYYQQKDTKFVEELTQEIINYVNLKE